MFYTEVTFHITPFSEDIADALIAELGNVGYDSFSYSEDGFKAYIPSPSFNKQILDHLEILPFFAPRYTITWDTAEIENQDWNKAWEENFTPIVVKGKILVRAGFHDSVPGIEHEIIIDPKMSFGTGHHATTALMLQSILHLETEIKNKHVLDMGCGTGILSIMASKVGAAAVTGIDIDEWAYHNARENLISNHVNNVKILIGDARLLPSLDRFGVILANINRNILLTDMADYVKVLDDHGYLVMSGFYLQDVPLIKQKAEELQLTYRSHQTENNWAVVIFNK